MSVSDDLPVAGPSGRWLALVPLGVGEVSSSFSEKIPQSKSLAKPCHRHPVRSSDKAHMQAFALKKHPKQTDLTKASKIPGTHFVLTSSAGLQPSGWSTSTGGKILTHCCRAPVAGTIQQLTELGHSNMNMEAKEVFHQKGLKAVLEEKQKFR